MNKTKPRMKGLGRGLDALLAANHDDNDNAELQTLAVDRLRPGIYQPRTRMDPGSLDELAASIRSQGIMQPILVRRVDGGGFEIIAGERRWRAAQLAGLEFVPCLVRDIADENALALSLIENIQREDLNPLEEAAGIQRLINEFNMTHQQAADAVGRSRPAASNLLRLLQLPKSVQELMMAGDLDMGHGRALLALDKPAQIALANDIANKRLSVRETESLVNQQLRGQKPASKTPRSRDTVRLEEGLSEYFGATVQLQTNKKGAGKLTIQFSSNDELDGVLQKIKFDINK